jgi:hypothetical protein
MSGLLGSTCGSCRSGCRWPVLWQSTLSGLRPSSATAWRHPPPRDPVLPKIDTRMVCSPVASRRSMRFSRIFESDLVRAGAVSVRLAQTSGTSGRMLACCQSGIRHIIDLRIQTADRARAAGSG